MTKTSPVLVKKEKEKAKGRDCCRRRKKLRYLLLGTMNESLLWLRKERGFKGGR